MPQQAQTNRKSAVKRCFSESFFPAGVSVTYNEQTTSTCYKAFMQKEKKLKIKKKE